MSNRLSRHRYPTRLAEMRPTVTLGPKGGIKTDWKKVSQAMREILQGPVDEYTDLYKKLHSKKHVSPKEFLTAEVRFLVAILQGDVIFKNPKEYFTLNLYRSFFDLDVGGHNPNFLKILTSTNEGLTVPLNYPIFNGLKPEIAAILNEIANFHGWMRILPAPAPTRPIRDDDDVAEGSNDVQEKPVIMIRVARYLHEVMGSSYTSNWEKYIVVPHEIAGIDNNNNTTKRITREIKLIHSSFRTMQDGKSFFCFQQRAKEPIKLDVWDIQTWDYTVDNMVLLECGTFIVEQNPDYEIKFSLAARTTKKHREVVFGDINLKIVGLPSSVEGIIGWWRNRLFDKVFKLGLVNAATNKKCGIMYMKINSLHDFAGFEQAFGDKALSEAVENIQYQGTQQVEQMASDGQIIDLNVDMSDPIFNLQHHNLQRICLLHGLDVTKWITPLVQLDPVEEQECKNEYQSNLDKIHRRRLQIHLHYLIQADPRLKTYISMLKMDDCRIIIDYESFHAIRDMQTHAVNLTPVAITID